MKVSQAVIEQVQAAYLVKAEQMARAVSILERGELRTVPDSDNIIVKSQSKDRIEYIISPRTEQCPCPAYGLCVHLVAFYLYRANQRLQESLRLESTEVINQRELDVKQNKPARAEYSEELPHLLSYFQSRSKSITVYAERLDSVAQLLVSEFEDDSIPPHRYTPLQLRDALMKWLDNSIDALIDDANWHVLNHNGFNQGGFHLPEKGEGEVVHYDAE